MKQVKRNSFTYKVPQLQKTTSFFLTTNEFNSQHKWIRVNRKAVLGTLKAYCSYPEYLQKPARVIENTSDLTLPEGTNVRWEIATKNTSKLQLFWQNKIKPMA